MTLCSLSLKNKKTLSLAEILFSFNIFLLSFITCFSIILSVFKIFSIENTVFIFYSIILLAIIFFFYKKYYLYISIKNTIYDLFFILTSFLVMFYFFKFNNSSYYWDLRIDDWAHYNFCKNIISNNINKIFYIPGLHFIVSILSYITKINIFGFCNFFIVYMIFNFCAAVYFLTKKYSGSLIAFITIILFIYEPTFLSRFLLFLPENLSIVYFIYFLYLLTIRSVILKNILIFFVFSAMILTNLSYFTLFSFISFFIYSLFNKNFNLVIFISLFISYPIKYFFFKNSQFLSISPDRLNIFNSNILLLFFVLLLAIIIFILYKNKFKNNINIFLISFISLCSIYLISPYIPFFYKIICLGPRTTYITRYFLYFYISSILFISINFGKFKVLNFNKKTIFIPIIIFLILFKTIGRSYNYIYNCIHLKEYFPNNILKELSKMRDNTVITNWPDINIIRSLTNLNTIDGLAGNNAQIATHIPLKNYKFHSMNIKNLTSKTLYYNFKNIKNPLIYISKNIISSYITYKKLKKFVNKSQSKQCIDFYSFKSSNDPVKTYKKILKLLLNKKYFTLYKYDAFSQSFLFKLKKDIN